MAKSLDDLTPVNVRPKTSLELEGAVCVEVTGFKQRGKLVKALPGEAIVQDAAGRREVYSAEAYAAMFEAAGA